MFVIDLIYNLSTLVALSIVSGFIYNRWSSNTQKGAILQGVLFGVVAMLGMINPYVFDVGLVFDGRSVVISLCGLFFGPVSAAISALMAIALRVYQGGVGAIMGVSVISASALIGVLYHYRRKQRSKKISLLFLWWFGLLVHFAMLALTITLPKEMARSVLNNIGLAIIIFYPLATILIGKILNDQEVKSNSVNALRDSEALFRSIAHSSPTGIWRVDNNGVVNYVNERLCEILEQLPQNIIGKHFFEFAATNHLNSINQHWIKLVEKKTHFSLEYQLVRPSGSTLWVISQFQSETNEYGDIVGYVGSIIDINERKNTEIELRRWETIFKSTRVGIVIGKTEELVFDLMNPAFAEMYGYTIHELKGTPIASVFDPTEKTRIGDELKAAYEKGFHVYETWHIKRDGTRFPVLISITAIKDDKGVPQYRIVNVQDISKIKDAEIELREQHQRLENIIEGTDVGTWEWNIQTGEVVFNERWANMIGYQLSELQPISIKTWEKFTHPEDLKLSSDALKRHFDGNIGFYECEVRMKHSQGHWIWILDRGKVIQWSSDGKPLMMYGTHKDITDRKILENNLKVNELRLKEQNEEYIAINEELSEANLLLREKEKRLREQNEEYLALNEELIESYEKIKEINRELMEAREKAEESDRLKSAFLANMSHEIRTPMNAIVGFSDVLLRPNLPHEKQMYFAKIINASCNQLLRIINDILDISKIETGQMQVLYTKTNLNDLIRSLHSLYLNNAQTKNLNFSYTLGLSDSNSFISIDEAKLNQILTNLISNAIKFTDFGQINFGYSLVGSELEFYVSDTGIGIPLSHQSIIFDRFQQVDSNDVRSSGGTGLGLAISKAFVELLGGNIRVESVEGKGSTFWFSIPHRAEKQSNELAIATNTNSYDFSNLTILIAEDEYNNFLYLKELLETTGATILHASDGAMAVEHSKTNPKPDIILMDVMMPNMNGLDATQKIKSFDSKTPIIALTAYALSGDKEKCLRAGCDAYISKPILQHELFNTIARFSKHRED